MTGHHVSSTCRIGRADDPDAVVDASGRVHGIEGLRIVDASIMPDSVRANIHATVLALAEVMAERIRAEHMTPETTRRLVLAIGHFFLVVVVAVLFNFLDRGVDPAAAPNRFPMTYLLELYVKGIIDPRAQRTIAASACPGRSPY